VLEVNLDDDELAWELQHDGAWTKVDKVKGVNTHVVLANLAQERARRRDGDASASIRGG
jgi:hypothetical protein